MQTAGESIAFLHSTYEEALKLTREARDYLAYQERADRAELPPAAQLVASCEAMRLTSRVTQVMAWLLVQKAVHAGEIGREEARRPPHRLSGHDICAEEARVSEVPLPARLEDLLARSGRLFSRVARLDAMLDRKAE